jgi:hypothetical protein
MRPKTCIELGIEPCIVCNSASWSKHLTCWIRWFAEMLHKGDLKDRIAYAVDFITQCNGIVSIDHLRTAIRHNYPEHLQTLDTMLLLR